ncbi:DUF896 domain-containing protein [uncultured Veillonella sp.]|uniref:DUF896 domain-containing protein n=1 Tax=uncultured Veillonella sp. TaxID=159268 RepID=UPI0025F59A0A|nr:DUF896 domain-containing protein [uncultured Veillonella sp.]MDY3974061.1 DUF896 domain-containing protein [Veillonella caviae]
MNINDTLKRINELAHKKKSGIPLTEEELAEKKELYAVYLSFIRNQVKDQLDRIEFVDEEPSSNTSKTDKKLN